MKASDNTWVVIALTFIVLCKAGGEVGEVEGPTPFALMDLTELMKSLNTTYEELASSLESLKKPESNDQSNEAITTQSASKPPSVPTTAQTPTPTQQVAQPKAPQAPTKTASSSVSKSNPSLTSQPSAPPVPAQPKLSTKTSTDTSKPAEVKQTPLYSTTQPRSSKPASLNPPATPPKDQSKYSTTLSRNVSQTKAQPTQQSSKSQNLGKGQGAPQQAVSSSNSSAFPTFGPGPSNKALPPVIDLTKLIVDKAPIPKTNASNTAAKPAQSAPSSNNKTSKPIEQKTNTVVPPPTQTQTPTKTNTAISTPPSVQPIKAKTPSDSPPTQPQQSINQVYLPPVTPPPKQTPTVQTQPKPTPSQPFKANSLSFDDSQYPLSSKSAIYSISPSYQAFAGYFIISDKDEYLPAIQAYLMSNYGTYLSGQQIIAGFRLYNSYENSLDYQLLYLTSYGTFTAILTYSPDSNSIRLKSLSILNFFIMEVTYPNCLERDNDKQNCRVCKSGFRNFMGRCRAIHPFCLNYITDECGGCTGGRKLVAGVCQ